MPKIPIIGYKYLTIVPKLNKLKSAISISINMDLLYFFLPLKNSFKEESVVKYVVIIELKIINPKRPLK